MAGRPIPLKKTMGPDKAEIPPTCDARGAQKSKAPPTPPRPSSALAPGDGDPEDAQWDNMKSGQQPAGRAEDTRRGTTWAWGWAQPGWPPGAQGSYPSMPETHAS